jgi:hypothetical protein
VSAAITALLGTHAQGFQALSAKAAAFHDDFVNLLSGGVAKYFGTEAASASALSGKFGPFSFSLTTSATGVNGQVTLNAPLHPALSFGETQTSSGVDLNATGTFNTPLGTLKWLTVDGSVLPSTDGAFQASLNARTPFAPPTSLSVTGTPISSGGEVGEVVNATGTFKTPFGPLTWLTVDGSVRTAAGGAFQASLSEHTLFGPTASLSATGTPISSGGEVGEALNATGTFKTPFGPVTWLTANGSATVSSDGAFQASVSAHTPGVHEGASVTGTVVDGTPQITGGSISVGAFKFSF